MRNDYYDDENEENAEIADAYTDWLESLSEMQMAFMNRIYQNTQDLSDVLGMAFTAGWEAARQQV